MAICLFSIIKISITYAKITIYKYLCKQTICIIIYSIDTGLDKNCWNSFI